MAIPATGTYGARDRCAGIQQSVTGLARGTRVSTLDGALPVEYLEAGDRIVTHQGAMVLRHVAARKLAAVRPVVVRAGSLGLSQPSHDLVLAPGQPVHLPDWRARVQFGSDKASAPVSKLVDGRDIFYMSAAIQLVVYDLEFDVVQVFHSAGVALVSAPMPVAAQYPVAAA